MVQNRGVLLVTSGKNMEHRMDFFSCPSKGVWDGIIRYSTPKGFVLEVAYKTKYSTTTTHVLSSISHDELNIISFSSRPHASTWSLIKYFMRHIVFQKLTRMVEN